MNNRVLRRLARLNEQRHLYSIRSTFISTMPIMIAGAYAVVFNQLPIAGYQRFMQGFFGDNWRLFGELVFNGSIQIVTLMVVFWLSSNLAKWYNTNRNMQIHDGISGMVALASYIAVSLPAHAASLPFEMTGVNGLFVALLVSIIATEAFVQLLGRKQRTQLLSDDPNMAAPQSFASVVPAVIVTGSFVLFRVVLIYFGLSGSLTSMVNDMLRAPFLKGGDSYGTAVLYNIATHLMWLVGIHGNNVLDDVAQTVFVPAAEANVAAVAVGAAAPNLVTKTLFDTFVYMGGSGTTLALLIALLIFGRRRSNRTLLRYALPNSLFNINEPIIFGIPVVLDPFYAIPFILTPVVMFFTTSFAMGLGLVPYTVAEVSWATPIFISGYLATQSIAGLVLQLFNLILAVLIYAPFVRLREEMAKHRFTRGYRRILKIILTEYAASSDKLIERVDESGAVARQLANQLRGAVNRGEMHLKYQPIIDPTTQTVHSVEALLRWDHPEHGPIHPMVVIALAEETDFIHGLGLWILEQAIAQRARWTKEKLRGFPVSVNISVKQLDNPDFFKQVLAALATHQVPVSQLQIEITEAAALVENETVNYNLRNLHDAGVAIAMDDFGVGHSSLLYLKAHSIAILKIDGSLSSDVIKNPLNLELISMIHHLCQSLNIEAVVEYVDNREQLAKLLSIGEFLIQGYLYSPPISAAQIPEFIDTFPIRFRGVGVQSH